MKQDFLSRAAACIALTLGALSAASAQPITWTIENAQFDDGTSLTGSFIYDANTSDFGGLYTPLSISVTNGTLSAYTYTSTDSNFTNLFGPNSVLSAPADTSRYLNLTFVSALTDAGGMVAFDLPVRSSTSYGSYECNNCKVERRLVSGYVTTNATAAVPEPASLALFGLGLAGVAGLRRRKGKSA